MRSRAEWPSWQLRLTRNRKEDTIASKIFVGNVSYDTTQTDLEILFSEVGDVVDVFMPADRTTGRPRGFAFIEFAESDEVAKAIEKFDGHELKGRALRINEAEERPSRPPRMGGGGPDFGGGGGGGGGGAGGYQGQKRAKPKGSRRKLRGKKRSL